jgi:tetratricopeptide (TPR) repeat protein
MAMLYHDRRELDKAVAVLKLLLDRGRNPDWRVGLLYAECLRDAGQAQGALKFLQGLLQEHAGRPEALVRIHYTMGGIYQLPGVENEAKAEEHLKSALALDPSHAGAANALGYFYAQKGQHLDEAEKLLEGALKQQPDEPAFLDSLGWIYYKQALLGDKTDRLRRALAKLQAAVKGLGQGAAADPVVACHLADVCFVSGEWEQAKDWWERALAAPQEPGAEPIDRELTQRKLTLVTNRLRDELRQQGQPRKSGERMARPLAAPMP